MTAASWPKVVVIPDDAVVQWAILREALAVREPPCSSDPELWHSRDPNGIAAASDACHGCHAFAPCGRYAQAADEVGAVWAGRDRAAKQSKGKTA